MVNRLGKRLPFVNFIKYLRELIDINSITMITIKDIALEANVSEGTVDRVLHKRGGVSKNTQARIEGILKKHNFKVNPVARALAMKKKFKLMTLIPNFDDDNLFWKSPFAGISKAREEVKNYGVEVTNYFFDQFDVKSYLKQFDELMKTEPSAIVFVPTFVKETKQIIDRLEKLDIPYLFFNIDLEGFNNISFIGQDSFMGGYMAGKLMHLSVGNNSSLLIVNNTGNVANYHAISRRIEGFNEFFRKNDIQNETFSISLDKFDNSEDLKNRLSAFLDQQKEIKGVFVPSSRISTVVEGIDTSILDHLVLIGFDNTDQNLRCLENNTVSFLISQKPFEQGYEAVHLMADYLAKNKVPAPTVYSPIDILTKENARYNERQENVH